MLTSALIAPFVLLAPLKAQALAITGTVLGPDAKPMANATLMVYFYAKADDKQPISKALHTDASGKFRFEVARVFEGEEKLPALGIVYGKGGAPQEVRFKLGENAITLLPGRVLRGKVVDEQGKAVAGAKVISSYLGLETTTDTQGAWALESMALTEVQLIVMARGFQQGSLTLPKGKNERSEPTKLLRGGSISGKLLLPDGKPAGGISLILTDGTNTSTKPDGSFLFEGVAPGSVTLSGASPELIISEQKGITVTVGKETALGELKTKLPLTVRGVVRDKKTGAPMTNLTVIYHAKGGGLTYNAVTDDTGRYQLTFGGEALVLQAGTNDFVNEDVVVTGKSGETVTQDLTLVRKQQFQGIVQDESGKPVAGVRLYLSDGTTYSSEYINSLFAASDAKGSWKASALDTKAVAAIKTTSGEWEILSPKTLTPEEAEKPLTVVVRSVAVLALRGRAVDLAGKPIANANIEITARTRDAGGNLNVTDSESLRTDAEGRYEVKKFKKDAQLSVQAWASEHFLKTRAKVTKSAEGFTASDLVFVPLTGIISGRVTSESGKPLAGALVYDTSASFARTVTDSQGRFILSGVPEKDITLKAALGRVAIGATIKDAKTPQDLSLGTDPKLLTPAERLERARELLQEVVKSQSGTPRGETAALLLPVSVDEAFALAKGTNTQIRTGALARLVQSLAKLDINRALALAQTTELGVGELPDARFEAIAALAKQAATVAYRTRGEVFWRLGWKLLPETSDYQRLGYEARLVELTRFYAPQEYNSRLQTLLQRPGKQDSFALLQAIRAFGPTNPAAAEQLISTLPKTEQSSGLIALMETAVQESDLSRYWQRVSKEAQPDDYYFQEALHLLIRRGDLTLAEQSLNKLNEWGSSEYIARLAHRYAATNPAKARKFFEDVLSTNSSEGLALAALFIQRDSKLLGDPAWVKSRLEKARKALYTGSREGSPLATARYLGGFDGAACRYWVESGLALQDESLDPDSEGEGARQLAAALAPVDLEQAIEIARSIRDPKGHNRALRDIATFLLNPTDWLEKLPNAR